MAIGPIARVVAQVVVAGVAVLARALPAAYAQALQNAKKSGVDASKGAGSGSGMFARKLMSRSEALQVLNITEEQISSDPAVVMKQYERYFAANAVEKGGSFYLQSKVHRAKEQLDEFLKEKRSEETTTQEEGKKAE
mmetsp:Transcript_39671/g.80961  ORF Transcript_39671/g.80961 Transcript_39671/m.80961 type:complete len:137 (-) Transcript_39671:427-837(-)|eukprot:CAMPEP_0183294514 /NCGR_PEP_ID=MMETSP0160_2-20130417/2828_1 /TAXON_ID=2839 ORGANISM="Odontella Sinensis, Strain Grunow 1884" /NCGR_SAMPLE_ID=MMETSP0160_2 /ASSEMBLY_ACC=CAM_ASM_000250 /LENGTH=136 /DNA_ID=CAMNT_0025455853 /DNA_START=155 /DNA_END=565 /DNA_ORIENTATION=-